ncbi:ABC transporter permease [Kitasatospora sp. NPDC059648]|uniref:ABC transporter permease n=1 Tax=Kitasatospora sp. NPDC059648 TaxID=3346894 RepID=UPI0036BCEB19
MAAGFRLQLALLRRSPGELQVLFTVPLYTLVFLSVSVHTGHRDLASYAVLAPVLIALWSMALFTAGDLIGQDRADGLLETVVATPTALISPVTGRIGAVVAVSLLSFGEAWIVAEAAFGIHLVPRHPVLLVACLLLSAFAMVGTAATMACAFVLTRSARIFQNSLSFPVYLLGGVLVPVSMLPGPVQPLSRLVFLSWSSGLLRDCFAPAAVSAPAARLAAIAVLGLAGYLAAGLLMRRVLRRVHALGTLDLA